MSNETSNEPTELTMIELDAISGGDRFDDVVVAGMIAFISADLKAHPLPPPRLPGL